MTATSWQNHSVRAFFTGLRKKGLTLVREERTSGELAYRLTHDAVVVAYLAPDIVNRIVDGTQPAMLTRLKMLTANDIPLDWNQQREMFGFSSST
jgi:predicted transcriptional regulator